MPVGTRIRANNVYGGTSVALLAPPDPAAVSFSSTQLQLLPSITSPSQHAVIVLDPKRVFGEPEIVVVTAHAGFGTTATITRGSYGTTARLHPLGTAWIHIEVDEDFIEVLTSTSRPTDPYVGEFIYETNTVSQRFYNGSVWNSIPAIGTLIPYLGATAPTGYLLATGAAVSRTGVTADLFAAIGTTYGGGDGSTTFNLPNMSGRIPVGRSVIESEFDVLGETAGEKVVVLDQSKLPQHLHDVGDWFHRHPENAHNHDFINLPFVGNNGNHIHGGSISGAGAHDHQTNISTVMVIAAAAGPFNVSAPGAANFVTFDVGGTARTSSVGNHGHSNTFNDSGAIMQPVTTTSSPVLSNSQPQVTHITVTELTPPNPNPTPNPTHNNIQPYIIVNYLIKI